MEELLLVVRLLEVRQRGEVLPLAGLRQVVLRQVVLQQVVLQQVVCLLVVQVLVDYLLLVLALGEHQHLEAGGWQHRVLEGQLQRQGLELDVLGFEQYLIRPASGAIGGPSQHWARRSQSCQ